MLKKEYCFTYKNIAERKRRNLLILDCIRRHGTVSRTDISKETDINIVSISNYLNNYIKKGLVLSAGCDESSGGRRPELVTLNTESVRVVGVDIGPEQVHVIIGDLALNIKEKKVFPRPVGSMDEVLKETSESLGKILEECTDPLSNIRGIGIGASGVVDISAGTIRDTDPTRGRTGTDFFALARLIEDKFKIPTMVGNDATCGAFGEYCILPAGDMDELLFVYSDVGCGIVLNGDIYCGASGVAGEIQLFLKKQERPEDDEAPVSSYGIRGVDLGIVQAANKLVENGEGARIAELAKSSQGVITKELIFKAAAEGDEESKILLEDAAKWLGLRVAYLVNLFNPRLIVIGGGMEAAGSHFMDELTLQVKRYSFEEAFNAVKVVPSYLGEDAIALGAVALSVRELFLNA